MTVYDLFVSNVSSHPDATAVHHSGVEYSYRDIYLAASDTSRWLISQGVKRGDRVVLMLRNSPEYIACYLGILQIGGIVVALNPQMGLDETETILADCRPSVMIVESQRLRKVAERVQNNEMIASTLRRFLTIGGRADVAPTDQKCPTEPLGTSRAVKLDGGDIAQIIYTSGTTGTPKGVVLTHKNILANCCSIVSYLSLTRSDSVMVILPFFYSYGNSLLFTHLAVGAKLILAPDFVFWNRVLDVMEREGATGFSGVPSSFSMLLHRSDFRKRRFRSLRYLTCAGGRLAPAHAEALLEAVPHAKLFLMYGQTEATARLSTLLPEDFASKPGSIGKGIPGVQLSVLDEDANEVPAGEVGEIVAKGDNMMAGYWGDPELTERVLRPEGLRTGDLAYRDADGYIHIVGRKDDMIKSGAHRIFPSDVEDAMSQFDEVLEVAVVGMPDEILYQKPVAFVVPRENGVECTSQRILEQCRAALPPYKRPRQVYLVDSLPKTASGKVRRSEIREMVLNADLIANSSE